MICRKGDIVVIIQPGPYYKATGKVINVRYGFVTIKLYNTIQTFRESQVRFA